MWTIITDMAHKTEIIKRAMQNGTIDKASIYLSLSYIVMSVATNIIDEASDMLALHGLDFGEFKREHNALVRQTNKYFATYSKVYNKNVEPMEFFKDYEKLDAIVRRWAKLEDKFKRIEDETARNKCDGNNQ